MHILWTWRRWMGSTFLGFPFYTTPRCTLPPLGDKIRNRWIWTRYLCLNILMWCSISTKNVFFILFLFKSLKVSFELLHKEILSVILSTCICYVFKKITQLPKYSVFWPCAPRQKDKIGGPAQICLLFRNIKSTQDVKMTKMGRWTASSYTPFTSSTAKGVRSVPAGFKDNVSRDQCSSRFEGTVSRDHCSTNRLFCS